jgi:hypothetical protein
MSVGSALVYAEWFPALNAALRCHSLASGVGLIRVVP